jgi:hypothetical protein
MKQRGIGIILSYIAICFHMLKEATNLYKYKTQGFQEIFDVFHHYSYMGLLT